MKITEEQSTKLKIAIRLIGEVTDELAGNPDVQELNFISGDLIAEHAYLTR